MRFQEQEKQKAVTFSYDDGVTQDIRLIELLNKYNLKCTFNLNSERLGKKGMLVRNGMRIAHYKIHPEHVKEIYEGHEVAVHTLTHPNLTTLDEKEIIRQVEQDRLNLSELVGYEVVGMAYPWGCKEDDQWVGDLIRENTGVRYCRYHQHIDGHFDLPENLHWILPTAYHLEGFDKLMKRAEDFIALQPDKPQMFYIWGHSYEMDYAPDYWSKLEDFFKLISNRDDIFYGTNAEVLL